MTKILILCSVILLSACQAVGPIFVNYNGVRRDVAQWINQQTFLSMQQKRSLAQLSKAQQKIVYLDKISEENKSAIAVQNQIALQCAERYLNPKKIEKLQDKVFALVDKEQVFKIYNEQFPKVKIDEKDIICD